MQFSKIFQRCSQSGSVCFVVSDEQKIENLPRELRADFSVSIISTISTWGVYTRLTVTAQHFLTELSLEENWHLNRRVLFQLKTYAKTLVDGAYRLGNHMVLEEVLFHVKIILFKTKWIIKTTATITILEENAIASTTKAFMKNESIFIKRLAEKNTSPFTHF